MNYAGLYLDQLTMLALLAGVVFSTPVLSWLTAHLEYFTTNRAARRSLAIETTVGLLRTTTVATLFLLCVVQLAAGTYNPFIYFRF